MVSCKTLCLLACIALIGVAFIPQEVSAGGGRLRLLAGLVIAKALKPRFIPLPLPLPFPIKFKKESHKQYPVHTHSHSAHAEMAHMGHMGMGHMGMMGHMGGY